LRFIRPPGPRRDIEIYRDEARSERPHHLAQPAPQNHKPTGRAIVCLADFRRAEGRAAVRDWVGALPVSAGGIEEARRRFRSGQR